MDFRCEGLLFQPFTSVHRPCECLAARVNALFSKPSHSKPLKISRKHTSCEGVNTFFGKYITYIRARGKRIHQTDCDFFSAIYPLRLPVRTRRDVLFTSRRLFFTTRRVDKTTPGLLGTIPGLFRQAYLSFKIFSLITFPHPKPQWLTNSRVLKEGRWCKYPPPMACFFL